MINLRHCHVQRHRSRPGRWLLLAGERWRSRWRPGRTRRAPGPSGRSGAAPAAPRSPPAGCGCSSARSTPRWWRRLPAPEEDGGRCSPAEEWAEPPARIKPGEVRGEKQRSMFHTEDMMICQKLRNVYLTLIDLFCF